MSEFSPYYERMLEQHDKDLYRGNGKPGVTIRLEKNEDAIKKTEDEVVGVKSDVTQIRSDIRKVAWLVVAAVILEVLKLVFTKI